MVVQGRCLPGGPYASERRRTGANETETETVGCVRIPAVQLECHAPLGCGESSAVTFSSSDGSSHSLCSAGLTGTSAGPMPCIACRPSDIRRTSAVAAAVFALSVTSSTSSRRRCRVERIAPPHAMAAPATVASAGIAGFMISPTCCAVDGSRTAQGGSGESADSPNIIPCSSDDWTPFLAYKACGQDRTGTCGDDAANQQHQNAEGDLAVEYPAHEVSDACQRDEAASKHKFTADEYFFGALVF